MADVFISYSQKDNELAHELAQVFERLDLSVWWDAKLLPIDEFDERIKIELSSAKAVVVIWTKNSTQSLYVKGEARQAVRDKKLVSTRSNDLDISDLPFDLQSRHLVLISEQNRIVAAVQKLCPPPKRPREQLGQNIDTENKNAAMLLEMLVAKTKSGKPRLVSYYYAYEYIFKRGCNSKGQSDQAINIAMKTGPIYLEGLGEVYLDTFLVSKKRGKPNDAHWEERNPKPKYSSNDWNKIFEKSIVWLPETTDRS